MKRLSYIILAAAITGLALWSCKDIDNGTVDNTKPVQLSEECQWIYDQLCESYYWNGAVKKATPKADLEYDEFLFSLLSGLNGASDDSERPATMDGGYYDDGTRYIYSHVDRIVETRASESAEVTFGLGFQAFYLNDAKSLFCFLITWTQPGGAADKAGIKRGMWIYKYNGKDITYGEYEKFFYQLNQLEGGNSMSLTGEDGKTYDLTAEMTTISPILCSGMVSSPKGNKAAYLAYNSFEMGDNGEFDAEIRRIFGVFKSAGAKNLILDLRYNRGGYISCCQLLSSLAANVNNKQVFAKLQYNSSITKNNPETWRFLSEANSLKLNKVYVLATEDSASASEMVINSLRGVDIEVIHIGTQTEGKNVGMDRLPHGNSSYVHNGFSYEMWPITFKIKNAKGFCDYAGGFAPNFEIDEFFYRNSEEGIHELGNPKEELLRQALVHIDGGTPIQIANRALGESKFMAAKPLKLSKGGAKVVHNDKGEVIL